MNKFLDGKGKVVFWRFIKSIKRDIDEEPTSDHNSRFVARHPKLRNAGVGYAPAVAVASDGEIYGFILSPVQGRNDSAKINRTFPPWEIKTIDKEKKNQSVKRKT